MSATYGQEAVAEDPNRGVWYKSSHSVSNSHCVETQLLGGRCAVRDSKNIGPVLSFVPAEWHAFVGAIKRGELEPPAVA
jgi:hypothetical protein